MTHTYAVHFNFRHDPRDPSKGPDIADYLAEKLHGTVQSDLSVAFTPRAEPTARPLPPFVQALNAMPLNATLHATRRIAPTPTPTPPLKEVV